MSITLATKGFAVTAAAALAAGSAAVLGASTAQAVPVELSTTYNCVTNPAVLPAADFSGKLSLDLPSTLTPGSSVPATPVNFTFTIPDSVMDTARDFSTDSMSGTASGINARFGSMNLPVADITLPDTPVPPDGELVVSASTTVKAFTAPGAGSYAVKVPTGFSVAATAKGTLLGDQNITILCTLKTGAADLLGTVTINKVASTTTATLKKKVTTAKKPKVAVTVTGTTGVLPTGKVTAKLGKKVLATKALAGGKVTLKLPKLKAGKRKIKIDYEGDGSNLPSKTKLTIKVKPA